MYDAPCSRVGHIYRKFAPFSSNGIGNYLGRVCNVNSFSKLDLHWDISSYPRIVVSTILALIPSFLPQNYRRVAEIWMDEYKEYVYKKRPGSRNIDMGEVSMRGYDKRRDFSTLFNRQGTSANNWSCENG